MILDGRRVKVREIAETMGLLKERVGYILHEELDMKNLNARWVPHLLTADHKRTRIKISEQCLERFIKNKIDFVRRYITTDETWIHHYTPEPMAYAGIYGNEMAERLAKQAARSDGTNYGYSRIPKIAIYREAAE
jgi:hypothetical protein